MNNSKSIKKIRECFFVFIGLIIFIPILFTSCSAKPKVADGTIEIKIAFWGAPEDINIITNALKPWQNAHPNISVHFEHTPYSGYDSKLLTRIAGGVAPDIAAAEVNQFVAFSGKNVFLDLTPYVKKDPNFSVSKFFPAIMNRFTRNGKVYAIPRDVAPFACVFYNKDLFDAEKLAYPQDTWAWSDMLDLAKKLTKREEKTGRVKQYGLYGWAWQNFIYGNGGSLVDNVEHPTVLHLNDPKTIEGLQFFSDLINKYKVMPTPTALANSGMGVDLMFASGRLAMFISGIWETPALREKYSFRWDVAMFPKNDKGIRHFGSGGTGYGILKTTQHPKEAWEIVKALTSPEVQGELARRGLAQPALRAVSEGKDWALNGLPPENKKMLNEAVKYIIFDPFHPKWREVEAKLIVPQLDLLKSGKITAAELAQNVTPEVNEMLKSKN